MGIMIFMEYLVKMENSEAFLALLKERQEYFNKLKEVKSVKILQQTFGGVADTYIDLWEMENISDIDSFLKKAYGMEGFPEVANKLKSLIEPGGLERRIWTEVLRFDS
jgi:hypothetical protein